MTQPVKNILIVGGTGFQGSQILHALLDKKVFHVKALVRQETLETKKEAVEAIKIKGGEIVIGDISNIDDLTKAAQGCDTIVSAVTPHAPESNLIAAAVAAGVKRIVPSQWGIDVSVIPIQPEDLKANTFLGFLAKQQNRIEEIKAAGLEYTHVSNSFWPSFWYSPATGFDVKNGKVVVYNDGNQKYTTTLASDVAKFVPEILLDPNSKNQHIRISGDTVTQNQAIAIWEQVSGKKLEVIHRSLAELEAELVPGKPSVALGIILTMKYPEIVNLQSKSDNWRYPNVVPTTVKEYFQQQLNQ